jgi:hypothetical protein
MDEMVRLRLFRATSAPSPAARAAAAQALQAAMRGRPHRGFRPAVVVAALVAAVIVTAAYAVVREVIVGAPAPPSVTHAEQLLTEVKGQLIPQARKTPGIEIGKTIAAAAIATPVGPAYIWVAPDRYGGYCPYLQIVALDLPGGRPNLSGGCTQQKVWVGISLIRVRGQLLGWLQGHATLPGARTINVRFADGSSHTYPLTNGFILAVVNPNAAVASTAVLDAAGHILASHNVASPTSPLTQSARQHRAFQIQLARAQLHTVATLRTIGTHRLLVEEGEANRECKRLHVPDIELAPGHRLTGAVATGCGTRPLGPTSLDIGPGQFGAAPDGLLLLWGPVGTEIRSLEILFQDGTHVHIPIHEGYILYQINPKNYASGHRPTKLVGRNDARQIVEVRPF